MSRHIFIALPLSRYLQDEILAWGEAHPRFPVKWLEGKNLHVTLVTPWYELLTEKVIEDLKTVPVNGPLDIKLEEVNFGPEPNEPRLIWARGEPSVKLLDLKVNIEQAMGREITLRQPFLMHVTMARFPSAKFDSFPVRRLQEKADWQDEIDRFVIMETRSTPAGSDYEIIHEFKL